MNDSMQGLPIPRIAATALTACALLLGACRDDDGGNPNPTPTPTAQPTASSSSGPTATPEPTASPAVPGAIGAAPQTATSASFELQRAATGTASNFATAESPRHRLTREELTP